MAWRLVGVAALIFLLGLPLVVWATQNSARSTVDTQSFAWTSENQSTSSKEWKRVRGLPKLEAACARGGATSTLGIQLVPNSASADVRIVMDDLSVACGGQNCPPHPRMWPGSITFEPPASSFTFTARNVPGIHGSAFKVQWRSTTGARATLDKATLLLLWNAPPGCR